MGMLQPHSLELLHLFVETGNFINAARIPWSVGKTKKPVLSMTMLTRTAKTDGGGKVITSWLLSLSFPLHLPSDQSNACTANATSAAWL